MSIQEFSGREGIENDLRTIIRAGSLVHHDAFDAAIERSALVIRTNSIGVLDGEPGTGKTTAAKVAARSLGCRSVYMMMPANPSQSHVLRLLGGEWMGPRFAYKARQGELQAALRERLVAEPALLIVDEAQLTKRRGLSILQYLHDSTEWSFPMLLVGHNVKRLLETELDTLNSRVGYTTYFHRLTGEVLYDYLAKLDPRLGQTRPTVLQHINDTYAEGRLRNWSHVVATLDAHGVTGPVDMKVARALLAVIVGGVAA